MAAEIGRATDPTFAQEGKGDKILFPVNAHGGVKSVVMALPHLGGPQIYPAYPAAG